MDSLFDIMDSDFNTEVFMHKDESLENLTRVCNKFHKTVVSFCKTMTTVYIVLFAFVLVGAFSLGVEIGKTLCR